MTKVIENIHSCIGGEELGILVVYWDMAVSTVPNAKQGKENWYEPATTETRTVANIRSIELQLFDKVGLNITVEVFSNPVALTLLHKRLINSTLLKEVDELQEEAIV